MLETRDASSWIYHPPTDFFNKEQLRFVLTKIITIIIILQRTLGSGLYFLQNEVTMMHQYAKERVSGGGREMLMKKVLT